MSGDAAASRVLDYSWRDLAGVAETLREPIHTRWLATGVTVGSLTATCSEHASEVVLTLWEGPANDLELLAELRAALYRCDVRELAAVRTVVHGSSLNASIVARLCAGQRVRVERFASAELAAFDWSGGGE